MLPVFTKPRGCRKAILDGASATLISPRTSPRLSLLGAGKPFITGALVAFPAGTPLEADCFRTRSAQDFGGGGATGANVVASFDCSVLTTSSLIVTDSVSALDLPEATESRWPFLLATGLDGIAGMTGITGMATRETFCCVGVCCGLTTGVTAEDGVVGRVEMWSDCVSEGIVVGVSAGVVGSSSVMSSVRPAPVVSPPTVSPWAVGVGVRSGGKINGS